jgi:hypothetical protein
MARDKQGETIMEEGVFRSVGLDRKTIAAHQNTSSVARWARDRSNDSSRYDGPFQRVAAASQSFQENFNLSSFVRVCRL